MTKKQTIQNILLFTLWATIGAGTVTLLLAAIQRKDANQCMGVDINIKGVSNNFFVDKNDILNTIGAMSDGDAVGKTVGSFNLKAIEMALQKNTWIKNAQLFFDNNERLQVNVLEREPVARVFTATGRTFYIDSSRAMLPLSEKFSARLPVFTNFPSDKRVLSKADSNLLRDILEISRVIQEDAFHMAMIDQIDITPQRTFEMIPKFGNSLIVFGDAKNAKEKFDKLRTFYKEVVVKAGWSKYSEINVRYHNQVVAKRKGAEEVKADSLGTLQLMRVIAENAERLASDSIPSIAQDNEHNTTDNSIIQQSIERDDNSKSSNTNEDLIPQGDTLALKAVPPKPAPARADKEQPPVSKKQVIVKSGNINEKPLVKPLVKPKVVQPKKPKLLMPKPVQKQPAVKGNEY